MKIFGQSTSTRAALAPRFAGIALGLLSVLTGSRWLMLLACACAGALITALILRPNLDGIELTATLPARTMVGSDVECEILVANAGTRWTPLMHAVHAVDLLEDIVFRIDPLPPGGTASRTFSRAASTRGIATTSGVVFTTTAPLGLRLRKRIVELPMRLIVHPQEVPVVVPPPGASDSADWIIDRSGTDVHGIREWRPGDDANQVHWRSSARRGRLVVLERELPKAGGLALVMAAAPGDEAWETVVAVAAWTGAAAVRAGRDVTLVAAVAAGAEPGPDDATTILDWCAQSRPALPDPAQLEAAFLFVGRGGDMAVAAAPSAYRGWWQSASSLAARHDITLVALPLDVPGGG